VLAAKIEPWFILGEQTSRKCAHFGLSTWPEGKQTETKEGLTVSAIPHLSRPIHFFLPYGLTAGEKYQTD
jgi:hypothetical protein